MRAIKFMQKSRTILEGVKGAEFLVTRTIGRCTLHSLLILSHIFDPFFRVDPSRDPSTANVGLGLAIARRAVPIRQGSITAEMHGLAYV